MPKPLPVALIAAGKFSESPITGFARLADQLGPVKAPSFRLASRISNHLKVGHPVPDFSEFKFARVVLLAAPDDALDRTLAELAAAEVPWRGKSVLLCSARRDSLALRPLVRLGAWPASVYPIPGFEERRYLAEGHPAAVREAGRLIAHGGARMLTIESGRKPLYLAALTLTGSVLSSLVAASAESLRHSGLTATETTALVDKQVERTLRAYWKAGGKAYRSPGDLAPQLNALSGADPRLARYLERAAAAANELMTRSLAARR
jgi:predicted short-subunit dehydrogenase-like oxidoreductase (DUF2520 family)